MSFFIGLSLPDHIASHLSTLRGSLPSIHWSDPDTYHIALCFIGELKNYQLITDIDLALENINCPCFDLTITGVNHNASPTHENYFSALVPPTSELIHLKKKIEYVVQQYGIKPNKKRFNPHIPIASGVGVSTEQIENWLYQYNLFKTAPFKVHQFSLFHLNSMKNELYFEIESNYNLR